MSELTKFMMMIIAIAFLAFLNSAALGAKQEEKRHGIRLSSERKLPI